MKATISFLLISFFTLSSCTSQKTTEEKETIIEVTDSINQIPTVYYCDYLDQKPPGKKAVLFSPNFISTKVEHSAVMLTPDGTEMWIGRMYPAKIWYLTNANGAWSEIKKAPLDDKYHYLYPFLSPDGNKLYFTSDRPTESGKARKHRGDGDLWYIERDQHHWSEPIHLGDSINFGNRHSIGSVGASGNIYYVVRTGQLYHYNTEIYFAEFVDGSYKTPVPISELDSDQPSSSPYVSPDEQYLIFSSFRGGMGMSDLFISFKKKDGSWSSPKNLGANINSNAKDEFPYVTPDGKFLFFNSSRKSVINEMKISNGPGNMYWVDAEFIEELKDEVLAIKE